ncbi:MAG: hypothetical protein ACRD4U_05740 [Candidatus Acidiferrales bacterium]
MKPALRIRSLAALLALSALLPAATPAQKPGEGKNDLGERRLIKPAQSGFRGMREGWALSDLVLRGRVVDERAELSSDAGTVWTHYTLEVLQVFKHTGSEPEPKTVSVTVEGGNVASGDRVVSVVNEVFPPLPWVREHMFFLVRNEDGSYRLLGGAQGVFRLDEEGNMRCHLPKPAWDFLCRSRDGSKWEDLIKDMRKKY